VKSTGSSKKNGPLLERMCYGDVRNSACIWTATQRGQSWHCSTATALGDEPSLHGAEILAADVLQARRARTRCEDQRLIWRQVTRNRRPLRARGCLPFERRSLAAANVDVLVSAIPYVIPRIWLMASYTLGMGCRFRNGGDDERNPDPHRSRRRGRTADLGSAQARIASACNENSTFEACT
jgi:hypothetical protein